MRTALAISLCLASGLASAEEIPRVNTNRNCYRGYDSADRVDANRERIQRCLTDGREGYDALKPVWDTISGVDQRTCIDEADLTKPDAYAQLKDCAIARRERRDALMEEAERLRASRRQESRQ